MEVWGKARYGDPCRECGYDWSIGPAHAMAVVASVPDSYARLLAGRDATRKHPDLTWSAAEYVCHVTDNLRIWSERLAGASLADPKPADPNPAHASRGRAAQVASYDPDLLAAARHYDQVAVAGALWSLRHAVASWTEAVLMALESGVVLQHETRGDQHASDVALNNAHDASHHAWDIQRILDGPSWAERHPVGQTGVASGPEPEGRGG